MKKILFFISMFALCLTLTACDDTNAILNAAKEELSINTTLTENIDLPDTITIEENEVNITWSSSNTAVLTDEGVVTRQPKQNIEVILTATLEFEGTQLDVNFIVTVEQL